MTNLNIVILCGGSGSRLWPLSRKYLPKQFLPLTDDNLTMFQLTCQRVQKLDYHQLYIICNQDHVFLAEQQLQELDISNYNLISEPFGRNTAPAIAMACQVIDPESHILVLSSDHLYQEDEFASSIRQGLQLVDSGIVVFGIQPTYPETGYGYIHFEDQQLISFVEKPNQQLAQQYLDSGDYLWNSGNFLFSNQEMTHQFKVHCPKIWSDVSFTLINSGPIMNKKIQIQAEFFKDVNPDDLSIDFAIMERLNNGQVIAYQGLWSDIGSFRSLYDQKLQQLTVNGKNNQDSKNNVFEAEVYDLETKSCFVKSDKLVATIGLENLMIVDTADSLLVADINKSQDIKKIVKKLEAKKKTEIKFHTKVYRPWGYYINVNGGDYDESKIKRIVVYPGKRLSLQSHNQRSEHWVIVKGHPRVQVGEKFYDMKPKEHIFIPVTEKHRMENNTDQLVEFVETQIGQYLGEDDIIRYQDDFGRV